jgi:ASPM-SPD-2-Hydin domain-containing protein
LKQQTTAQQLSLFLFIVTLGMLMLISIGCGSKGALSASTGGTSPSASPTPAPPQTPGSATITATPASLTFGSSALNTTATQTVKIANTGTASATITQDSVTGTGFSTGLTTPLTLGAGQSVNATVVFTPTTSGALSGSLSLSSNGVSLLKIPLSGTGVTPIAHSVDISWLASATSGLQGYNVYRGTTSGGPYSKISSLLSATTLLFTDNTVVSGQHYFYVVTDLNTSGVESATSNEVAVTVPVP